VSVLLCMAFMAWLTRGLHHDGPAISGAAGLVFVLALKAAALHGLATRDLLAALAVLPLAQAWSQTATVVVLRLLPADDAAQAARPGPWPRRADGLALLVALVWAGLAAGSAAFFLPADALLAAAAACVVVTLCMARWLVQRSQDSGATALGATQPFSELATCLAVLAVLAAG